jgi:hypothetical protein
MTPPDELLALADKARKKLDKLDLMTLGKIAGGDIPRSTEISEYVEAACNSCPEYVRRLEAVRAYCRAERGNDHRTQYDFGRWDLAGVILRLLEGE